MTTTTSPLRVAVAGATGRMGQMLIEAVRTAGDCALAGALDREGSPALGQDAGGFTGWASGVAVTADLDAGPQGAQGPSVSATTASASMSRSPSLTALKIAVRSAQQATG